MTFSEYFQPSMTLYFLRPFSMTRFSPCFSMTVETRAGTNMLGAICGSAQSMDCADPQIAPNKYTK